jgi:hypothetical protein
MPIVKQPSKITASGHKSFLNKKLQFSLLLEENKASEIAKIMRLDENHRYLQATAASKTGLKLL